MLKSFFLSLLIILAALPLSAQSISLETLLDEMIDRDAVTKFPEPAYTCVQASSYDRAAKSPTENWFANGDSSKYLREEMHGDRKEWVLMDAEGPGAIVRWWITSHHYKSVCRIYLDGSDTPTIEANIGDLIGGNFLADAPLSAERARGRNLYLPIPYAKHCKVTIDDMPAQQNLYYQINYRTYKQGTAVDSFTMETFKALKDKVDAVQKTLLDAGKRFADIPENSPTLTVAVPKGGKPVSLIGGEITIPQPAALQQIVIKIDAEGEALAQALRSNVLAITFDGKETVWCPLGDFFGSGIGINPYKSWYTRVEKDGKLISLWKMPFKKSMNVQLINYGKEDIKVVVHSIWAGPYKWDKNSMYFHADWRQQRNIETVGGTGTMDWNYTKIKGRGVFVGDVLAVLNRHTAWWGEGDEKIYVDGETFPSHFGTGTEDYYGYAWCTPQFFESPFHFQPRAEGPNNYGNVTNGRVRLLDGIPFTKDFRFDMEVWHWTKTKVDYAVATFWYGFEGASLVDFQSRADQIKEVQSPVLYKTPMSLDYPGFKIEKAPTAGNLQLQGLKQFEKEGRSWHDSDHLWWTGAKPGDKLELILETDKAGMYNLFGELTTAKDYAIAQFSIDGKVVGKVDFYTPEVSPMAGDIGEVLLQAGKHVVSIEILGKNEKADPGYMVGIDQLVLQPVQ